MIAYKPEISEYSSDKIIELLDNNIDFLEKKRVSLFMDISDKKFIYKLFEKLYECCCQVTVISSIPRLFNTYNNRDVFENSDIVICKIEDHSIFATFHPSQDALIVDLTGESLNEAFIRDSENNKFYQVITAMEKA